MECEESQASSPLLPRVTLDANGKSFWEALDLLCRNAKVHFAIDRNGLLLDEGSPAPYPVVYSGGGCSFYYWKWQKTGSNFWKRKYYACIY